MKTGYSVEKAVQIVIALLKKSNIHRVIVSPGSANDTFVFSVQSDPFLNYIRALTNGRLRIWRVVWRKKQMNRS